MVVAGDSDDLLAALAERSLEHDLELALLVPAAGDADRGARLLRSTLARFRAAGLYVRDATVARDEPAEAAARAALAGGAEEVLVAEPERRLRRGPGDLAERIAAATGLPVEAVAARRPSAPRTPAPAARPASEPRRRAPRQPQSPRVPAARALAAAGLALLALAAASAAVGDEDPPAARPAGQAPPASR